MAAVARRIPPPLLFEAAARMRDLNTGVKLQDWPNGPLKTHYKCCTGAEIVDWLVANKIVITRNLSVEWGQAMINNGLLVHVSHEMRFVDNRERYFFIHPVFFLQDQQVRELNARMIKLVKGGGPPLQATVRRTFKTFKNCVVARELVDWLSRECGQSFGLADRNDALALAASMALWQMSVNLSEPDERFQDDDNLWEFHDSVEQAVIEMRNSLQKFLYIYFDIAQETPALGYYSCAIVWLNKIVRGFLVITARNIAFHARNFTSQFTHCVLTDDVLETSIQGPTGQYRESLTLKMSTHNLCFTEWLTGELELCSELLNRTCSRLVPNDSRPFTRDTLDVYTGEIVAGLPTTASVPSSPSSTTPITILDELDSLRAQLQTTRDELATTRAQHARELVAANAERDAAREAARQAEAEAAMEVRLADQRTRELRAVEAQLAVLTTQKQASDTRFEERDAAYMVLQTDKADLEARHTALTVALRTLESAPQIIAPHVTLERGVPLLGKGALGEVLAARYHGMPVAVKRLFALQEDSDYGQLTTEEAAGVRRELRRECETLARLRSPFLVAYYGFTVRESDGGANPAGAGSELQLEWVVMERLEPLSAGPRDRARHVLYCLARALQYLHERGIIHRDVKPTNILYDRKNDVYKLSDLGEAQLQSRRATLRTQYAGPRGTIDYMAPEMKNMIEGDEMTDKIDVFSFAVTAVELLIGAPPTLSANAQRRNPVTRQLESIPEVERRAGDLARLAEGEPVKAMVIRCLAMNPEERPSAKECAEHFDTTTF